MKAAFLPGDSLVLSDSKLEALGNECCDLLLDMERDHEPLFNDFATRWDWYEAIPKNKEKNWPWPRAANMIVPLIQVHSDALIARLFAAVHRSSRLWSLHTESEPFRDTIRADVERFLNRASRTEFDTFFSVLDWISEFVVQGESVMWVNWDERRSPMLTPAGLRRARNDRSANPVELVTTHRGPRWEYVPREQTMWYPWGCHIDEAEAVTRQHFLSWSEVSLHAQANDWDRKVVAEIKEQRGGDNFGFEQRRKRRERSGLSPHEAKEPYDIRQVYVNWPTLQAMSMRASDFEIRSRGKVMRPDDADADVPRVPLLVTLHRQSKKVLDVRPSPYILPGWPAVDLYFRRRPGAGSTGVAKKLEMLQRALSVSLNQSFDAVTRANAIWAKTTDASFKSLRLSPNEPIHIRGNMTDFELLNAPKSVIPDIALMNFMNVFAERMTGASDPLLGRESRSGGHPSPATNFLGMLEEANKLIFPASATLNRQLGRAGQITATHYQQFDTDPEGRLRRIYGNEDGPKIEEWLFPTDATFVGSTFEVRSLAGMTNANAEAQKHLLIAQVNANYFASLARITPMIGQSDQLTRSVLVDAIGSFTTAHKRFLEASEVDDVEKYLASIADGAGDDALAGLNRAIQEGLGSPAAPPGGGNGQPPLAPAAGQGASTGLPL